MSVAVRLAQDSIAQPSDSTVLLIGAGDTIELAAHHLAQAKVKQLLVANQIGRDTSELQSLMRLSYAVFCLKKKTFPLFSTFLLIFLIFFSFTATYFLFSSY